MNEVFVLQKRVRRLGLSRRTSARPGFKQLKVLTAPSLAFLERRHVPGTDSSGVHVVHRSVAALGGETGLQMSHQMLPERGSPAPGLAALHSPLAASSMSPSPTAAKDTAGQLLTRARLQDLVHDIDPSEQLDEEVEELLLQLADDFVETTVNSACVLAKHRRAAAVHIKDVQLHLERNFNMWIPGFGTDELRPYKRSSVTEAHKQRMALIRKTLKKY